MLPASRLFKLRQDVPSVPAPCPSHQPARSAAEEQSGTRNEDGDKSPHSKIVLHDKSAIASRLRDWETWVAQSGETALSQNPRWLTVLAQGLGHEPYCIEAVSAGRTVGLLPLAFVRSLLFGRYLVSLPYLNSGGVIAKDRGVAGSLITRAVELANSLDVRHLELRHEEPIEHPALGPRLTGKVHMRLKLPSTEEELWKAVGGKVRNQVRKGESQNLTVHWGGEGLLDEFYAVFAHNMRDLGTPVFSRGLFAAILAAFPDDAEVCAVRLGGRPIAAAMLLHGAGTTEVPSASSLHQFNGTNANMLMYWHLLRRAIQRRQSVFDFGRSSIDGNTFRFKKQWGAGPEPAVWQYYVRSGDFRDLRVESGKYRRRIAVWRRLPAWLTTLVGPSIVRGIP